MRRRPPNLPYRFLCPCPHLHRKQCLLTLVFLAAVLGPGGALAMDALVLGREVLVREAPQPAAQVVRRAEPGQTFPVAPRKGEKDQLLYALDGRGDLWVKVQVGGGDTGFVRTDLVSVAHEEFRSPRGDSILFLNLRSTADGSVARDLWLIQNDWQHTRRLATIWGRPVWGGHGDWFLCETDSGRPVSDQSMDRTVEVIEKFSANGHSHSVLTAGSYPILDETRGEIYFYRDVDEHGVHVPPGLYAVKTDGSGLRPIFLLPEHFRFWKEDGDYFVQAPPPRFRAAADHISLFAFDRTGVRTRFKVALDGHLLNLRVE